MPNYSPRGTSAPVMDAPGQLCARSRFWASLRVDGELSELESALLDAHLARCAACRAVVAGFATSTEALRAAPLVEPEPVAVRRVREPRRFLASAAVAVVVIAGAVLGGLIGGTHTPGTAAPRAVAVVASVETPDQLRRLRRTALLNQRRIPRDMAAEPV